MIQDMVAETLKGMSSYLDLLALNWYHITQRESYRRMRRQMQSESRIIPLVCVYSYITAPSKPNSLRTSPSTQTTQQKVLLFQRCHSPSLCAGLIKSSLADKLLIQNFKKKNDTLYVLSPYRSSHLSRLFTLTPSVLYPLPVFSGERRKISETIPCDYLPLPLRHVRPVQRKHEARVITLFLQVQELLYRGTSGVVA